MKRLVVLVIFFLLTAMTTQAGACVGKVLYIGVTNSPHDQLLAEMISALVTERTGTTVKILTFKSSAEIYNAVRHGQVGLIVENTDHGLEMVKRPKEANAKTAFDIVKKEHRKTFNLVWLEPLGTLTGNGSSQLVAPVISLDILGNLPALPKLINKLAGIVNDSGFTRMAKMVKADEKPNKLAREFLKAKKLI